MTLTDEQEKLLRDSRMFHGSRDFLLAYRLLGEHRSSQMVRAGRAPSPLQSWVTCAAFSLELALKCRISLDGSKKPPKRGRDAHDCAALFSKYLSEAAQRDIASGVRMASTSEAPSIDDLVGVLRQFDGTFNRWRYLHEDFDGATFHEGDMMNVIAAVHESILRLHPDWRPWRGVIQVG